MTSLDVRFDIVEQPIAAEDKIVPAAEYRNSLKDTAHPVIQASLQGNFHEIVEACHIPDRIQELSYRAKELFDRGNM